MKDNAGWWAPSLDYQRQRRVMSHVTRLSKTTPDDELRHQIMKDNAGLWAPSSDYEKQRRVMSSVTRLWKTTPGSDARLITPRPIVKSSRSTFYEEKVVMNVSQYLIKHKTNAAFRVIWHFYIVLKIGSRLEDAILNDELCTVKKWNREILVYQKLVVM